MMKGWTGHFTKYSDNDDEGLGGTLHKILRYMMMKGRTGHFTKYSDT